MISQLTDCLHVTRISKYRLTDSVCRYLTNNQSTYRSLGHQHSADTIYWCVAYSSSGVIFAVYSIFCHFCCQGSSFEGTLTRGKCLPILPSNILNELVSMQVICSNTPLAPVVAFYANENINTWLLTSILTKKRPCIGQYVVCVLTNTLADTRLTHGLICGLCLLDKCKSICWCRSCKVFIRVEGDDFCTGFLKFHC